MASDANDRAELERIRAEAFPRSRDCPECGGHGLTGRYVPRGATEVSVGAICHRCPMGDYLRMHRDLLKCKSLKMLVDLKDRPDIAHEIFQHPAETRDWLAQREGYCEQRYPTGGYAVSWWRKFKTRTRSIGKGAGRVQRVPESPAGHSSGVEGEAAGIGR
jgi:hypothetical protein